jgi:hypothetical protein
MKKMMYLLVSQHVSGIIMPIIMPIIRRMVQKPTTPMVYSTGRAAVDSWKEVVRCALVGTGFTTDDGHDLPETC